MNKFELLAIAESTFNELTEADRKDIITYLITKFQIPISEISPESGNKNTINYTKEGKAVKFSSSFNDEIGEKIAESIIGVTTQQRLLGQQQSIEARNIEIPQAEIIEEETLSTEEGNDNTATKPKTSSFPTLDVIARKSIVDGESEWLLLFCFSESKLGKENFSKDSIKALYKEKMKGTNFPYNWKKIVSSGFIDDHGQGYFLTETGVTKVHEIVNRQSGSVATSSKSIKQASSGKKRKKSFELDGSLNLKGSGASPSLKDFLNEFKSIKTDIQFNVVATYYLINTLKLEGVNSKQIYTCYKEFGRKIPGNLQVSISRCSGQDYGYLERKDKLYWLTTRGENLIEHDLEKK